MIQIDWSQVSVGAVGGAVGTWLLGLSKTGLEHFLEGRKQRAAEERAIRAEEREETRKETERNRAEAEQAKTHAGTLLMYKIQLRGCADLHAASAVVGGIHSFFIQHKQYLVISANTDFLIKYPGGFQQQVIEDAINSTKRFRLDELKRDAENLLVEQSLHVSAPTPPDA